MPGRTRTKGQERTAEVLDVAERLLTHHGAEGLSVRAVASELGMSLGNLQYYFATRAELLHAVFERSAGNFRAGLTERQRDCSDPRAAMMALVDHWLAVQYDREQSLFWHLWAISAHDDNARETMDSIYTTLLLRMVLLLKAIHPGMRKPEAMRRSVTIASAIDGSGVFVGFGRTPHPELKGLQAEIRRIVIEVIDRPLKGGRG
jgi:AcrR family transcriptional regulator